ncbi:hypothetical protein EAF00_006814 [Botryotinia globosa]|nr:hypothetical protein EAF00_006814 [Botryotinia globosa]
MISFLCILFYILLPDLHSIIASPPLYPPSDSTITTTITTTTTYLSTSNSITTPATKTKTQHPCSELYAPARCFVTTYSTTTPFTWPAVGTPTKTRAARPKYTSIQELPLAPGTSGSCERYTRHFEGKSSNMNLCGFNGYFYGIDVYDFTAWNPSLMWDPENVSSCVLAPGYRYCVRKGTSQLNSTAGAS